MGPPEGHATPWGLDAEDFEESWVIPCKGGIWSEMCVHIPGQQWRMGEGGETRKPGEPENEENTPQVSLACVLDFWSLVIPQEAENVMLISNSCCEWLKSQTACPSSETPEAALGRIGGPSAPLA